ncbi:hypothetical protein SAMN05216304_102173 [Bosea sp. OK403]|uniref:hypothetical protein n=1 Tax=Bosea sp. OK403 TaxID=1855286 RepID=UPI0008E9A788|nr:hypothetical protein [Bosea sp. OK403]SFI30417.1 hypothetical protein SAMN05216304_102173 [Bosea sp. OK403]
MLRLALVCIVAAFQLSAASAVAQSSSNPDNISASSPSSSHDGGVVEPPSVPLGPSIQAVPQGWQSSRNNKPGEAPRSACQSDHNVGGFCLLN